MGTRFLSQSGINYCRSRRLLSTTMKGFITLKTAETKKVLERLANRPDVFIAIVSGRSVADVKSKVGIEGEKLAIFCRIQGREASPPDLLHHSLKHHVRPFVWSVYLCGCLSVCPFVCRLSVFSFVFIVYLCICLAVCSSSLSMFFRPSV